MLVDGSNPIRGSTLSLVLSGAETAWLGVIVLKVPTARAGEASAVTAAQAGSPLPRCVSKPLKPWQLNPA